MLFTATESSRNPYFNMIKKEKNKISLICNKKNKKYFRRQDAPKCFDLCTVCFIFKPDYVLKNDNLYSGKTDFIKVSKYTSLDIDTKFDLKIARLLCQH